MTRRLSPTYTCGLDLGQQRDYTALVILETSTLLFPERNPVTFEFLTRHQIALCHLERFPLRTSYTAIVENLSDLLIQRPLFGLSTLVLDATGPGLPVYDLLKHARNFPATLKPVTITAGDHVTRDGRFYRIPRRHLLSHLHTQLTTRSISVSPGLPDAQALIRELAAITHSFESSAKHDDLAIATALAAWFSTQPKIGHQPNPFRL